VIGWAGTGRPMLDGHVAVRDARARRGGRLCATGGPCAACPPARPLGRSSAPTSTDGDYPECCTPPTRVAIAS